jgi:FemAB family
MTEPFPPYFLQSQDWLEFWQKASGTNHKYHLIESDGLKAYVYEYPWYLGKKFWYLPKFPLIDRHLANSEKNKEFESAFKGLMDKILIAAVKNKIVYIKMDFDDYFTELIKIEDNQHLVTWFNTLGIKYKAAISPRTIQYLKAYVLNLSCMPKVEKGNLDLKKFYEATQEYWITTNTNKRRFTKRSIDLYKKGELRVSSEKTEANFEAFWTVHQATSIRQGFPTQPKEYLRKMCFSPFGRLIVVYNEKNEPLSVFAGIVGYNTLTYLCGGNTDEGLKVNSQYLLQFYAMVMTREANCDYYDMGGYEPGTGYGAFKEGYRGYIRSFMGPIDLVINPASYNTVNRVTNLAKLLKKMIKR